ncbi:flagellar biosynthetic protein FliR [Sabulicella rubraurantiaca]|uniref:flagellar biosynthetic protein FliR n=1 Tax=Sabulicella rubraurantiaca TaxID=2811429 RepID=UPI001A96DC19|nr:flagellar biosynthetic protein FliR [Sabulicella rubraurantiaca]
MTAEAALLAALPGLGFHAILCFARLGAAAMLLPGLGEAEIPATQRLAFGMGVTMALLPAVSPALPPLPESPVLLAALVAGECVAGLWFGMLTRVLALALAQAGQVIALMIGLSSPLQGDALLGGTATAPARIFAVLAAALTLSSGLYEVPLRALASSYAAVPPGGFPAGSAAEALAGAAVASLSLSLRLAAPFVLGAVLFNAALGLLARLAPQAQIFVLGAPAQLLGGMLLLVLLLPPMLAIWGRDLADAFAALP